MKPWLLHDLRVAASAITTQKSMSTENNAFFAQRRRYQQILCERFNIDAEIYHAVSHLVAPLAVPFVRRKGEYLQHAGEVARYLYWITDGVARSGYTTSTGTEITITFSVESHSAPPYHDLLAANHGEPARYFVIAETALQGFRIDWQALSLLLETEKALRIYHTKTLEYLLPQEARRSYMHIAASASDRLTTFRNDFPGLEARISQKVIASYLEITPQYLSQLLNGAVMPVR
jgi:CRP-like cAMP-binding protein